MYQNFIIPYLYEAQHVSGDTPPIIRSLKLHWQPLMMGSVSPKTCWASYKYGIIKFWFIVASYWVFLYELNYDARIHEHQILNIICKDLSSKISAVQQKSWHWKEVHTSGQNSCWNKVL